MTGASAAGVFGLRRGVRMVYDHVRGSHAVLYPEGVLLLNETAAEVLRRCDGQRDTSGIVAALTDVYDDVTTESVRRVLDDLIERRVLTTGPAGRPVAPIAGGDRGPTPVRDPVPVGLLAELTYRCPLRCPYCSNPVNLAAYRDELSTDEWRTVFDQARAMGVLQLHLSGGEPLLRRDVTDLVAHAQQLGMYTNLITSGMSLSQALLRDLADAGLDHIQLSLQDAEPAAADAVAGIRAHERKLAAAALIRRTGLPLTVNVVLHAGNLDRLTAIAELAVLVGAERLELAHAQYYGWGLRNRDALMPTPEQFARAATAAAGVIRRFGTDVEIVYVQPDYHTGTPKPCMNGWGQRQLVVAPNGDALPCLAAGQLPNLTVPNVRDQRLDAIWYGSPAFNRFRGTAWMPSPCRDCELREVDFGGCRCQAYQLTGDAAATDPVCALSPHHDRVVSTITGPRLATAIPRSMQ